MSCGTSLGIKEANFLSKHGFQIFHSHPRRLSLCRSCPTQSLCKFKIVKAIEKNICIDYYPTIYSSKYGSPTKAESPTPIAV